MVFATKWHLMTYFLMCTQGGHPSHRDAGPLTGWLGLSQEGRASYSKVRPLRGRPGLLQGGRASHRQGCHQSFWIYPIYRKLIFTPFLGTQKNIFTPFWHLLPQENLN